MTITAYVIEYLDGTFEYVPLKLLKSTLVARRSMKPTSYKKVVMPRDEARRKGVIMA